MSHRHVVVCDACGKESQFGQFGMWVRISMGGDILPSTEADICSTECIGKWLREEADRRASRPTGEDL